jgi:hypothetical protein
MHSSLAKLANTNLAGKYILCNSFAQASLERLHDEVALGVVRFLRAPLRLADVASWHFASFAALQHFGR